MYRVLVKERLGGKLVGARAFPFGDWMEIGLWLDNCGLNEPKYKLDITFHP